MTRRRFALLLSALAVAAVVPLLSQAGLGPFVVDVLNGIGQRTVDQHHRHEVFVAEGCIEDVAAGRVDFDYCWNRYRLVLVNLADDDE